ncbi:MAG: GNAT family N-acetyltransferase [Planctomycetota bacterium]
MRLAPKSALETDAPHPRDPAEAALPRAEVGGVLRVDELDGGLLDVWDELLRFEPALDRPFFTPEYARAFAGHVDGVRVAVLEDEGVPVGFLPFRLRKGRIAGPIARRLDDFQGPVLPARFGFNLAASLSALGARAASFDHLLERAPGLREDEAGRRASWTVDLSGGFDAYLAAKKAAGTNFVRDLPRKRRKLGREAGDVRYVHDSRSDEHLELMRAWKARQRRASGTKDPLEDEATWAALRALFCGENPRCRGLLSVLEADGAPVALHFGLVTRTTLHVWFPTYDGHERCSPGSVLLLDAMREASARGAVRIDLGTGDDRYKRSFQNGAAHVVEHHADSRRLAGAVARAKNGVRVWARTSPTGRFLKEQRRAVRRWVR